LHFYSPLPDAAAERLKHVKGMSPVGGRKKTPEDCEGVYLISWLGGVIREFEVAKGHIAGIA